MELLEGIETRRSTRAFKSTPIPKETIEKILRTASRSPSFTNTQPWEVAVVSGKKRNELSKILYNLANAEAASNPDTPFPTGWPAELGSRSREQSSSRLKLLGIEREDVQGRKAQGLSNFEFYGAPCILFLFMDNTLTPWSMFDMGLFAQSIALAAHSFGVGTCLQAMVVRYPDAVREFLGIPKTRRLIMGISIGYPDLEARINTFRSERAGLDAFVQWYT